MTSITGFIENFEPTALCLIASLIWAPLVLVGALRLDRGRSLAASEVIWVTALCLTALPTVIAPALAATGLSLRPVKVIEIVEKRLETTLAPAAADPIAEIAAPFRAIEPAQTFTIDTLLNAAGLIYVYGALLALGAYLLRAAAFARHVRRAELIDHKPLLDALTASKERLGLKREFTLRRSDAVSTVCVFGLLRPVILMPRDIEARVSFEDLALMGAHELAHVKRGDAALYGFAATLRILFWFNPFVTAIADRAELSAEQGADALVLSMGADRKRYAACFIEGLKFAAERAQASRFAVPAFTPFDRQSRRERLNAILTGEMRMSRGPYRLATVVAAVVASGVAFAQAGFAVTPETEFRRVADITISARKGEVMRAPEAGTVIEATDVFKGKPSLGKVVVIKHGPGRTTQFIRLQSYSVEKGARVAPGQAIGVGGPKSVMSFTTAHIEPPAAPTPPRPPAIPPAAPSPPVVAAPLAEAATSPEPPEALDPLDPLDAALAGADPSTHYTFVAPSGASYIFTTQDGRTTLVFKRRDGSLVDAQGRDLSSAQKERFERKFKELEGNIGKSDEAQDGRGFFWSGMHFDGEALRGLADSVNVKDLTKRLERAGISEREQARIEREVERAMREAERATRDAEGTFERVVRNFQDGWTMGFSSHEECDAQCQEENTREREEAEEERRQALIEAQEARAEALAEAEEARQEALAEAEEAGREAQEARRAIEEEIRDRAQALADAERDLEQERADLERLRQELSETRADGRGW